MKLNLSDVLMDRNHRHRTEEQLQTKQYTVQLESSEFEHLGRSYSISQCDPITLVATASSEQKVLLSGKLSLKMSIPCDRCLENVEVPISFEFSRTISFHPDEGGEEELDDWLVADGYEVDVDALLYPEILSNFPLKILCKDSCKGLCIKCGMNLNHGSCDCDTFVPDPRMAAFQDIFNQFKEE